MIPVPRTAQGFLLFTGGFHMMRRPIATEELSSRIRINLKEKNKLLDILITDYQQDLLCINGEG